VLTGIVVAFFDTELNLYVYTVRAHVYFVDSRSDIAWKNANYAQIWEYLRDEYELTQRFGNLDFKLKFVEVRQMQNIQWLNESLIRSVLMLFVSLCFNVCLF
jgi:hypothetical protein